MSRDEIITIINQLRSESLDDGVRAELLGIIHFESVVGHMARISFWGTLKRALKYASLFVCRFGFLSKEDSQRFRQGERGLAMGFVFVGFFTLVLLSFEILLPFIIRMVEYFNVSSTVLMLFPLFFGVAVLFWISRMFPGHAPGGLGVEMRIRPWCIGCGYELEGLQSALGDEVWVGPETCPECGQAYPAVGE